MLLCAISSVDTDVKRLRVDHHICGVLVGTLPQVAQQNIFLGLPLQLLPEEAAVLVAHGQYSCLPQPACYTQPCLTIYPFLQYAPFPANLPLLLQFSPASLVRAQADIPSRSVCNVRPGCPRQRQGSTCKGIRQTSIGVRRTPITGCERAAGFIHQAGEGKASSYAGKIWCSDTAKERGKG